MTKTLTFIRHAKSDWGAEWLKDIDRPLAERGYNDAYIMSDWYKKNGVIPDLVISSSATRALSTALIFTRALDLGGEKLALEPKIYEAPASRILQVIQKIDDSYSNVLLFGHNPGFTNIYNELSPDTYFDNIPTCGIVSYKLTISQ